MNSMNVVADERGNEFLGHPLEIIFEDGGCTPEGGATAAQALAADSQLVGLIGSACSDETVGGIAALTNAGLTTISPSATRADLTARTAAPIRRLPAHRPQRRSRAGSRQSSSTNELGLTKAATIHDGSPYAEGLVEVFEAVPGPGRHDHGPGGHPGRPDRHATGADLDRGGAVRKSSSSRSSPPRVAI